MNETAKKLIGYYDSKNYPALVRKAFSAMSPLAFGGDFESDYERENEELYKAILVVDVDRAAKTIYDALIARGYK